MGGLLLRLHGRLLEFFCTLFGLALGAIILLMCVDIAIRDLRLGSLPWLIEVTEYAMYGGTFLAAPWVLRQGSHVRVDIVLTSIGQRGARVLDTILDLIGLGICAVLLIYGIDSVLNAYKGNMIQYKTWNAPEWILLLPIPIGAGLLCVEFVLRIFRIGDAAAPPPDPSKRASI
jgi:TRAP-type C4-dicarboxylate transport system permease small subunit